MEEKGKKLTTINHIGLGLGGAIGTGIFVMLGYGIAYTGRSIMLVCAVGCLFMLLAYWFNFAMTTMFVVKGGDYGMKQMIFNPLMSGVSAYMTVVNALAFASYAVAVTQYLSILIPALNDYAVIFNVAQMTVYFLATIKGSRVLTLIQNAVTALLVVALTVFVIFGVPQVDAGAFFSNTNPDGPFFYGGLGGFFGAIAIMSWACGGTMNAPISMAAVTENPKKTLPKAIMCITVILAVIYGLMAYVAGGVLPYEQIAGQNISVTAEVILPRGVYLFFVIGGGVCAIISTVLGGLGQYRYPALQIANDGWLPAVFKKTTKDGYPYVFYAMFYIISVLPLLTGMALDALVSLVMIPTMFISMYMNFKMMELPKKFPEQWAKRSVKMPEWLWNAFSVIGVFCAAVIAYNLFKDLVLRDAILCVIIMSVMVALSVLRIKQGAVSKEKLEETKQAVIAEAIAEA